MKEKILNFTFTIFCFISLIIIFKNNTAVSNIIINAGHLFFTKVFVSLFPMFIINDLLINLNFAYYFHKIFNSLFQIIFKTSGLSAYVLVMSLISGTPSSAYIIKELLNKNLINLNEANHYLYFTYFSNPLFLYTMLSLMFPFNTIIKLILIHYTSNIILAFLMRFKAPPKISQILTPNNSFNLSSTLINSIKKSINTLLIILGVITFYMLLSFIIKNAFNLNPFYYTITSGLLELTNGLNNLVNLSITNSLKEIIAIIFISFGGFSIHTQIKSILEDTEIKYNAFFKGRIYGTLISLILTIIL